MAEIKIRFRDTDSTGRIFFSRYLEFFGDTTIEFFRERGIIFDPAGCLLLNGLKRDEIFVVAECHCTFLEETLFDDVVEISPELKEVGEKKMVLQFTCSNKSKGSMSAKGYMTFVCYNTKTCKSVRIPEEVRLRLDS